MTQEALKLALEALYFLPALSPAQNELQDAAIEAIKEALAQHDSVQAKPEPEQKCWCTTCRPITMADMRFVVCPDCGNKRCPKANDHRNACTNSNEVGQEGSSWEHVKPLAQHDSVQAKPEPELCKYGQEPKSCTSSPMDCQCAIDAALAQPEQEPVKYSDYEPDGVHHTIPPQRTWVGLTDEEMLEAIKPLYANPFLAHNALEVSRDEYQAIEAKLKEKNT